MVINEKNVFFSFLFAFFLAPLSLSPVFIIVFIFKHISVALFVCLFKSFTIIFPFHRSKLKASLQPNLFKGILESLKNKLFEQI